MNQTFNIHRFWLMLKLDFLENRRTMIVMLALKLSVMLLLMISILWASPYGNMDISHVFALMTIVILGGSFYTISIFKNYDHSSTGMSSTMLPASQFEKYLSKWLLNIIYITFLYGSFLFLHFYLTGLANQALPEKSQKFNTISSDYQYLFLQFLLLVQAFSFLGSIYFSKNNFYKSAAVLVVSFIVFALIYVNLAKMLTGFPASLNTLPFSEWRIQFEPNILNFVKIDASDNIQKLSALIAPFILVSMWFITYVRLKEKEI